MSEAPLTRNIQPGREPPNLREYEKSGGYRAARAALTRMSPREVVQLVKESRLRGRGGAGFPTGVKWSFMPAVETAPQPRYLVVNADEMEPGTFKDRVLLEGDPHQMLEGIIVSAFAVQAEAAYIFLRAEYTLAARLLQKAIAEARAAGYIGADLLGSGFNLQIHLHISAGRYMCGEESALMNALEGKRATPRAKPPYATTSGLWGRPTVINNVETLCNVPHIVNNGADWYRKLSVSNDGGTKIYGVSGKVQNPGVWELPMGTTIRELLEDHAGGMRPGLKFRGLLPGGASTAFVVEHGLDLKMDFDSLQAVGSRMGTGTMIVLDDQTCPVSMLISLEHFFAQESCGWCTPCREGLPWVEQLLLALESGEGEAGDLETLQFHARLLGPGNTFCALAPGAMEPLQSALEYFHDDIERHIHDRRCPWQ